MIRNMETWAQLMPLGKRKTVIIENADRMQDSARNAMLKILEEPPESTRFILLTTRRASMMSTVLSRSRVLTFKPRDEATTSLIIRRVFKGAPDSSPSTLQEFFDAKRPYSSSKARSHAERLTGLIVAECGIELAEWGIEGATCKDISTEIPRDDLLGSRIAIQECIDQIVAETGNFGSKDKAFSGSFVQLLQAMLDCFGSLLVDSDEHPSLLALVDEWSSLVRDAAKQATTYNRNPELLLRVLVDSCVNAYGVRT
jgi:DNA polymerase-3 subunit gamma/tau